MEGSRCIGQLLVSKELPVLEGRDYSLDDPGDIFLENLIVFIEQLNRQLKLTVSYLDLIRNRFAFLYLIIG